MLKKLVVVAVLACFVASPAVVARAQTAAPPVTQQEAVTIAHAFATWVQQMLTTMQHANAAGEDLSNFSTRLSQIDQLRPAERRRFAADFQTRAGQLISSLDAVNAELDALPVYTTNGRAPETDAMAAELSNDAHTYLANLRHTVSVMSDFMAAFEHNDQATMIRLDLQLEQSGRVLIQGQQAMLRAQQLLIGPTHSVYNVLGAMSAMYSGLIALQVSDDGDRRTRLGWAESQAAQAAANGRITLAAERIQARSAPEPMRSIVFQVLQLSEDAFAIDDNVVQFLHAHADMKSDDAGQAISELGDFERQYFELNQRRAELVRTLTAPPAQ